MIGIYKGIEAYLYRIKKQSLTTKNIEMKLGIVTSYPPSKVTLNEYAFHLVKNFREHAQVKEIILFTDVEQENADTSFEANGCKITIVQCWKFNSCKNVFSIRKAIKKINPDCVLYNLQFMKFGDKKIAAALGLFSPWMTKLMKIPTIVLLHNIMEAVDLDSAGFTQNKWKAKGYNLIGRFLTSVILKADKVALTISKYIETLKTNYKAENLVLIPHGTFELPAEPSYELPDGPLKVMTFGKFGTYKKVEPLIEAIESIRDRVETDLEIVIAGTDNPNTPGYLESVRLKYQHVPNLTFTGYVEEEDVPKIFSESAMVVFPYTSTTGSSGVLHQAGSYGKAVVMPNIGDLGILVREEGYDGAFFEPESTESMASAIFNLVIDENYRNHIAEQNYKAATALPMSEITGRYLQEFKEIITTKKDSFLVAA